MPPIEIANVSKTYRHAPRPALSDFSLTIQPGERMGMIGPNGSGKTTLLRLILNFIRPDRGEIRIGGDANLERARQWIGFVSERQEGMENFTPRELLNYAARMFSLSRPQRVAKVEELLDFTGLREVADELLGGFSKGMSQRLQIGLALIHSPKILLLDEPMSGLDPVGQKDVFRLLQKLNEITLVYASHNLEEIETFCNSVAILKEGRLVKKIQLSQLSREVFTLEINPADLANIRFPKHLQAVVRSQDEHTVLVELEASASELQQFLQLLHQAGVQIRRLRSRSKLDELLSL